MTNMHSFTMSSIDGDPVDLGHFAGQRCLVVNVASR